jgi:hypothetical protein
MYASAVDWSIYKPYLRCEDLAQIYPYTLLTIRKMAQLRNPKIPTPISSRPFVFRKDDVIRHYNRRIAA